MIISVIIMCFITAFLLILCIKKDKKIIKLEKDLDLLSAGLQEFLESVSEEIESRTRN